MTYGSHKERVRELASRQGGRVATAQLRQLGIGGSTVRGWVKSGYLELTLPGVYAVGHLAPSRRSDLWAAVLYAGPGAAISHRTAAQWRGLIDYAPTVTEVRTPRHLKSPVASVRAHCRRPPDRMLVDGIPTTSVAETMVDLAAIGDLRVLRRALSVLDRRRQLDLAALQTERTNGRPGARLLGEALARHQPKLAYVNRGLEEEFLEWCERRKLPLPLFNVWVHDVLVDAHWPAYRLVVELDGYTDHSTAAQRREDHARDLKLRRKGLTVLRYDWDLVVRQSKLVHADLTAHFVASKPSL